MGTYPGYCPVTLLYTAGLLMPNDLVVYSQGWVGGWALKAWALASEVFRAIAGNGLPYRERGDHPNGLGV